MSKPFSELRRGMTPDAQTRVADRVSAELTRMRYMTQAAKVEELLAWEAAKRARAENPPTTFTGGLGYPDPEMFAWCDRLNALSRLCTLQSCAGHRCTPALQCSYCESEAARTGFDPDAHVWNGQLWLWPDEKLGRWFQHAAPELAALPGIEKVSVFWHVEGREIIDIQFEGAGHGKLGATVGGIICAFFERGNRECNLS
jgi:hypothetical protein